MEIEENYTIYEVIPDIVEKVINDEYLKVSELAIFCNKLLGITCFLGKNINQLLLDKKIMYENCYDDDESKYIPLKEYEKYCKKVNRDTFSFYIWKPSFVLDLLDIDFSINLDERALYCIRKQIYELFSVEYLDNNAIVENMEEIKRLMNKEKGVDKI